MRIVLFLIAVTISLSAAERPNILWITSEDNDTQWLGCYGNKQAQTPRLDALAAKSARFTNFFSNAPVCAVARSTILNGIYAPSQGTQHMRSRHPIPATHKPYVSYLKELGYYCTNASKTDYNFQGKDKSIWDQCGGKAHYKNRKDGQPFFAIFNLTESHESSLFEKNITRRRKNGDIPTEPRIKPSEVFVPPYLPDLPEVRSDIAIYHDTITLLDRKIGKILDQLDTSGHADNTIIFYYSDHGGVTPRGKRYLTDTGVNVPLLVHVPEKWKHLSPFKPGSTVDEPAAFVDLAPTLLSLLGQETPSQMQGRAFLGSKRKAPNRTDYIFLFGDRFDELYGMRRGLTDGRWKYIRRFTPHYPAAPYSYYQFGQAAWRAWQDAWKNGKIDGHFNSIWEANQPVEELYDTQNDRWEIKNLANDPAYQKRLLKMRVALKRQMASVGDISIIPEPMFAELSPGKPIATYVASRKSGWPQLVELAFTATSGNKAAFPKLLEKLKSKDPIERYWAAQSCVILGKDAISAKAEVTTLLKDPSPTVRASAAHALFLFGEEQMASDLLMEVLSSSTGEYAQQNVVNIFTRLNALDRIPTEWIREVLKNKKSGDYITRLAQRLAEDRQSNEPK